MFTILTEKLKDAALMLEALNATQKSLGVHVDELGNRWVALQIDDCGLSAEQVSCFLNEPNFDEVLAPWDHAYVVDSVGNFVDYVDSQGYPVPLYSSLNGEVLCSAGMWWDKNCSVVGILPNYIKSVH